MSVTVEHMVPRHRFIRYDGSNAAGILAEFDPNSETNWAVDWEADGSARFHVTTDGTSYRLVNTGDYVTEIFGVVSAEYLAEHFIPLDDLTQPGG